MSWLVEEILVILVLGYDEVPMSTPLRLPAPPAGCGPPIPLSRTGNIKESQSSQTQEYVATSAKWHRFLVHASGAQRAAVRSQS